MKSRCKAAGYILAPLVEHWPSKQKDPGLSPDQTAHFSHLVTFCAQCITVTAFLTQFTFNVYHIYS